MASIFSSFVGMLSGMKRGERDDSSEREEEGLGGGGASEVPEQSPTTAALWRERALKGEAEAQYQLGECLYYGRGVPEDRAEAARWYLEAARQ
ncbi:MAG: SEL1-like repeat protein, partial [Desulfovibrio sp.]|nr:SEL1-like repeat protein [Desulfovibrio sp.]